MFFKKIDFLSPPVTFFYKGTLSHASIISGIISIISIILIILLAIYYSMDTLLRKNPKSYYYNTFVQDAGVFETNSNQFFHFISMSEDSEFPEDKGVNFKNFRILGFDTYFHVAYINGSIRNFDHWVYGFCHNSTDANGINYLINQNYFEKSACIRKYFSYNDQKYYDTNDSNFKWPMMAHGTFHKNKTFYSIVLERCREDTIGLVLDRGDHCSNDTEMNEILNRHGVIHFNFIDNYVDILNYKNPITKFFYRVENSLNKETYSVNHLNFNAMQIKTNNGLIWDKIKYELTYAYDRNDVINYEVGESEIYMGYYLWLNNRIFYYERIYQRLQDVISNIGGISQFITILASFLNMLYNKYIILIDMEELLSSSIKSEKLRKSFSKKYNIDMIKSKKNNQGKYNFDELQKDKSKNALNPKEEDKKYNKIINKLEKAKNSQENSINNNNDNSDYKNITEVKEKKQNKIKNSEIKKEDNNSSPKSFWYFLFYKMKCQIETNNFKIYEDFRTKIISEEHLIKNHLNIYTLLKLSKKYFHTKKRNSYQLKELIKLV